MIDAAAIDALYESTIKPRLEALEGYRLQLRGCIVKAGLCIGIPFALFFLSDVFAGFGGSFDGTLVTSASFVLIFVGVGVAGVKYLIPGTTAYLNYRRRFKHEVAAEVFRIVCPTATYAPTSGIAETVFDDAGIFKVHGNYRSDDRVRGKIGATPFEAADVSRTYSTGGKNSQKVVVFHGLFFHLDFNKRLTGRTVVQPAGASVSSTGDRSGLTRVRLENPAFDEAFEVYASDEVEARYILTPAMMERILSLAARTSHPVFLGFKGHRVYLGVDYGRALFEPGIAATTSLGAIQEMAAQFALAEGVVHELDLDTRIWTKDVDESLLHAPDDTRQDEFDTLAARGDVTAADLWQAAQRASGDADDDAEGGEAAAPSGTSIGIVHGAGTSVVHYGLSVGFFIAVVLSIVSVAVVSVAGRALPGALDLPELGGLVGGLPEVALVPDVVREYPIPFAVAGVIVGFFATLIWLFRVRRVEVGAEAVRIWRGLRPWPRSYARPLYGRVVRVDKAVFIGRSEGFSLINVSASPMLSLAEARWVKAELRRAMRATAR